MESEVKRSVSLPLNRRREPNYQHTHAKDEEGGFLFAGRLPQDYPMMMVWKRGFIRLVLVAGILWMLLILIVLFFHVWSCQTSFAFFSAMCNREGKVFSPLDTIGPVQNSQHRCPIPVVNEPNRVVIPEGRTQDKIVKKLTYITEDEFANNGSRSSPLFGGHQNWLQREESFKLKPTIKVYCGFMKNGGAKMDPADVEYVKKCQFVVASGIFDRYDVPHQPSNISERSKMLFCFLMVVDEVSLGFIKKNVTTRKNSDGGLWVGIYMASYSIETSTL